MIKPGINIYRGLQEISHELCGFLSDKSRQNNYTVALPGGNTPKAIFELLVSSCAEKVNWTNLQFFWGDERCVGPEHDESNYRMAYESLLKPLNIPSNRIHRVHGEDDPAYESDRYTLEILKNVPNRVGHASFNLIMLGMGDDGHTASIFPGQDKIIHSSRVCEVATHPQSGQKRITLTLDTINHAENIIFLITGKKKSRIIREIMEKNKNWIDYPASMVKPSSGLLYWMLDEQAANEIIEL
jgi:6-phosphogluconolactonase